MSFLSLVWISAVRWTCDELRLLHNPSRNQENVPIRQPCARGGRVLISVMFCSRPERPRIRPSSERPRIRSRSAISCTRRGSMYPSRLRASKDRTGASEVAMDPSKHRVSKDPGVFPHWVPSPTFSDSRFEAGASKDPSKREASTDRTVASVVDRGPSERGSIVNRNGVSKRGFFSVVQRLPGGNKSRGRPP